MTGPLRSTACPRCEAAIQVPAFRGRFSWLNSLDAYCDECAAVRSVEIERQELQERLKRRYFEALRAGLLSEHFRVASFAKSDKSVEACNPEAWRTAREWSVRDNLYIYGGVGTGKTFMALCALRKPFVAGYDVAEVTARRFVKAADRFDEGRGMLDAWKRVDVLLIDDIDKADWKLDRIDALWDLLNARMSANRRSIITGNVTLRDLAILMRERTGDRQTETRNTARADAALERLLPVTVIEVKGKSLRTMEGKP